jgi:excisionase family DNA binding protein
MICKCECAQRTLGGRLHTARIMGKNYPGRDGASPARWRIRDFSFASTRNALTSHDNGFIRFFNLHKCLQIMENFRDYLTVKEAAEFLGVTTATLRNWDRRGKLIPVRHPVNQYRLYRKSDLEELLNSLKTRDPER